MPSCKGFLSFFSRYIHRDFAASDYDVEYTASSSQIPPWVLPPEETQALFETGHGTTPDFIYARGVPDTPDPGLTNFDKTSCTLIFAVDFGFSRDLGCDKKHAKKPKKYSLVVAALKK